MVTGATDGVGFEAARAFAIHGARVIIHGRNREKAERLVLCRQLHFAERASNPLLSMWHLGMSCFNDR